MTPRQQHEDSVAVRCHTDLEVRYAETDQMGVVHHATYLVWFELARTNLCALTGTTYAQIEEAGYWLMVTGSHLSYRDGARYGETVTVSSWIDRLASRLIHFRYEARVGERLLVSGTTEHIWVSSETQRSARLPDELQGLFRDLFEGRQPTEDLDQRCSTRS